MDLSSSTDMATLTTAGLLCISGISNLLVLILPVPKETSGAGYRGIYKAINWVALNIGKATNATAVSNNKPVASK